jgi:hypothetical protein
VPSQGIEIQFDSSESFVRAENVPPNPDTDWGFWTYTWRPARTGKFTIRLRLKAANISARKLNSGYYDRSVDIAEI